MERPCFYCQTEDEALHLDGCPHKVYREAAKQFFDQPASNIDIVGRALSPASEAIDTKAQEAIEEFNRGFEDGRNIESARKPSEHPSYKLGLSRALDEAATQSEQNLLSFMRSL